MEASTHKQEQAAPSSGARLIRDIHRKARKRFSAEDKMNALNKTLLEELMDEAKEMAREMLKTPRLVLEMNKVTVNRVFEMMGMRAAMGFMGEMDVIAHMTKGGEIFGRIAAEKGAKEAFEWMNTAEKD